jgi:hypothetical protein
MWLDALMLALVLLRVRVLDWCWLHRFLASLLRVICRNMEGWDTKINAMHGVQRVVYCMIMSNLTILPP